MYRYIFIDVNRNVKYESESVFNSYNEALQAGNAHIDAWEFINNTFVNVFVVENNE